MPACASDDGGAFHASAQERSGACLRYVPPELATDPSSEAEATTRRGAGAAPFVVERVDGSLRLSGTLQMPEATAIWHELHRSTEDVREERALDIDLSDVSAIDGAVIALLGALRVELAAKGVRSEIVGAAEPVRPLIELYHADAPPPKRQRRKPESAIEQVGRATIRLAAEAKSVVSFFGEMVAAAVELARRPRSGHWKEVPPLVERTGADAVPIVILLDFLIGFVMAYQSARQLRLYGANIYVADLVGISVTRELAPLMTAIIVCGRSGAAFAAEIGSMKVSEEVDALRTIGLRPFAWLVVPRVFSLLLVVPALTVIGDIVGILGGVFVAVTSLDLTATGYLVETQSALEVWDVLHGLVKSVLFGTAIALIACQQGFAARGGAVGVGRRTTSTVVASLFVLVVLDALITIAFRALGH
jgi:phospholipid/cholesterol/gamma-HCH transport system permease protein